MSDYDDDDDESNIKELRALGANYLDTIEKQMRATTGISPYVTGPRLDRDGLPIPDGIQSGYATSILINSARARLAGPTYRRLKVRIFGRTLVDRRLWRVPSPRERVDRQYAAWSKAWLAQADARGWDFDKAPRRYTNRSDSRLLFAYATAYVHATRWQTWRRAAVIVGTILVTWAFVAIAWSLL